MWLNHSVLLMIGWNRKRIAVRTLQKRRLADYSIRHIMQHAGEWMERLGSRTGAVIDWVGSIHA